MHTVWVKLQDGKWYPPKDVSGLPRRVPTALHVAALQRKGMMLGRRELPRSRKTKSLMLDARSHQVADLLTL
jgi:hypothetical protein